MRWLLAITVPWAMAALLRSAVMAQPMKPPNPITTAVIPASMVLGNVALEYYHLDEALDHFERVVRESAQGTRDWVMGHQMAADVMAQQGFRDPAAAYAHAQQALAHTPESDDWHSTLQDHLSKAETLMGQSGGRMLN